MRAKTVLLTALLFTFIIGSAAALPNIKVNWLQYDLATGNLSTEIRNTSDENAIGFDVVFFVDGEQIYSYQLEEGPILEPKGTMRIGTIYAPDGKNHQFVVLVDSYNVVRESNESDNTAVKKLNFIEETPIFTPPGGIISGGQTTEFYDRALIVLGLLLIFLVIIFIMMKAVKNKYA